MTPSRKRPVPPAALLQGERPVVVTGAAGFIGSVLTHRLNQLGRTNLILVDALGTDARWKNLVPLHYADYVDRDDFLAGILDGAYDDAGIEAVFHLGACSSTTESDAAYLMKNNFGYTQTLAQWCTARGARLVYASSAATYGDGALGYADDHALVPRLRPLNAYGYSKQAFDLWALRHGLFDLPGGPVGLKYFNVYGPNEYHKGDMMSMVAKAHAQILAEGRVKLFRSHRPDYRDGEQQRDFLYVADAVDMTLHFLDPKVPAGLYNVGTGIERSWRDMMHAVFASMGREPRIDFIDMPEALRGKYQYHTRADISKIRAAGYAKPIRTLEQGVAEYVPYLDSERRIEGW